MAHWAQTVSANNTLCAEIIHFSILEVWSFVTCQPEAAYVSSPRSKLNTDSLVSFPGGQHVTCVDLLVAEEFTRSDSTGRGSLVT